MKKLFESLEKIEKLSGTNAKMEELFLLLKEHPEYREFFELVYNDTIYGVDTRSFEIICNYDGKEVYFDAGELVCNNLKVILESTDLSMNLIKLFLYELKEVSGKDLLEKLKVILTLDKPAAKWITRLILKDLKIGISLKSINKILDRLGFMRIEKFEVQLCGKFDGIDDPKLVYDVYLPIIASVKYDGMRGFLIKKGTDVEFISRNGKKIDYVPELIEEIKESNVDFILDGEILCKDFSTLQKRIGRKLDNMEPVEDLLLHFRVFDVLEYESKDYTKKTQKERTYDLQSLILPDCCRIEESIMCRSLCDIKDYFNKVVNSGGEGIILKKLDRPYEFGSRKNWMKIKPIKEATFEIVGYNLGTGKNAGLISSLVIEDASGLIRSSVGSGLSDNDMVLLLNLERAGKLKGSFVDIIYNEITIDKLGNKSLRFPRVLKIRLDKKEADNLEREK